MRRDAGIREEVKSGKIRVGYRKQVMGNARECRGMLRNARKCWGILGNARKCSEMLGNARERSGMLGYARGRTGMCGNARECSRMHGNAREGAGPRRNTQQLSHIHTRGPPRTPSRTCTYAPLHPHSDHPGLGTSLPWISFSVRFMHLFVGIALVHRRGEDG